jgi:hypothetical protein
MQVRELREAEAARQFLVQSLWLARVMPPRPDTVRAAVEWALEIAGAGEPLPPLGVVADLGHLALRLDRGDRAPTPLAVPGWPPGLTRAYEDRFLGKLYADHTFERAADALCRYQGRDKARGLAFVFLQFRRRARYGGVQINPAAVKSILGRAAEDMLAGGWESLRQGQLSPILVELYEELIAAARDTAEVLGPEDLFELEHGTALAPFSQRIALRQVVQAADCLAQALPRHRPRLHVRRLQVPTHFLDEDAYPVGGFSSISTRGSVESLLYSQLAYMEKENRPDLFDIKYLRDELLYYARDENQFLRQRRAFVIVLCADLVKARFKDADLPWQRIVLLLALLVTAVAKLSEWLSTDALTFEFLLPEGADPPILAAEQKLLEMALREPIARGTVFIRRIPASGLTSLCSLRARRSLCHCLIVSDTETPSLPVDAVEVNHLRLANASPSFDRAEDEPAAQSDDPMGGWITAVKRLLGIWA